MGKPLYKTKNDLADFSMELDRFEAKYIIPRSLVEPIKDFIRPYCVMDKHCKASGGHYYINTLQMDSPDLSLHYAKEWEASHRFKLRVRTYGKPPGKAPVFLEIKRKYFERVIKSRACIPFEEWKPGVLQRNAKELNLKSVKEREAFREFVRLSNEIDARPFVYIRYNREAFTGIFDHYARITFDSELCLPAGLRHVQLGRTGPVHFHGQRFGSSSQGVFAGAGSEVHRTGPELDGGAGAGVQSDPMRKLQIFDGHMDGKSADGNRRSPVCRPVYV